jgi:hypothetical protein
VEPSELQYLILNALDTLELLQQRTYDQDTGIWYILTPSPMLSVAMLLQNGDIVPITPVSEL